MSRSHDRTHRTHRRSAAILVLLAALASGPAAFAQDEGFSAYVNTTALNLRAAPGTKANILGILLKYDAITVLEQTQIGAATWYSVEAGGGYTNGWVNARYVAFGDPPDGANVLPEGPLDYGEQATPTLIRGDFKYVGPGACRDCHMKPTGRFHLGASKVWENHVHSSAYQTLKKDYTREIAQRTRGIDDPLNDWRCVKCHVTAFGADPSQIGSGYSHENGVTCEVCHGPGSAYANVDHGPKASNREAMGFRILKDLTERREVCTSCHNPLSPTYVPFNLREFSRDIAHWVDKGDAFYYEDAAAEATRRESEVQRRRQARAEAQVEEKLAAAPPPPPPPPGETGPSEAEKAAQAAREAAKREAAAKAEAERIAAEERRLAEEERRKAEAALAQEKAQEAKREAAADATRKQAEEQARAAAASSSGIERYLEDVDDTIRLNADGEKYNPVKFNHLAHASKKYVADGTCQTCHHTQEGDDSPEPCSQCHEVGGEADEEKKKSRAVHTKDLPYPKEDGQEHVSCVGCHKTQNEQLAMGTRKGKQAPTKCTGCHTRQ